MIIWSGFGFLALLIPIATCLLVIAPVAAFTSSGYFSMHTWPIALGILVGAVITWIAGKRLNGVERMLMDPQTGQPVVLRRRHSLFFIPMQYWAFITGIFGLMLLLSRSTATP